MITFFALAFLAFPLQAAPPTTQVSSAGQQAAAPRTRETEPTLALPEPSGPHTIATVFAAWSEGGRADELHEGKRRTVAGQIWYPASSYVTPGTQPIRLPYVPGPVRRAMAREGYLTLAPARIKAWSEVQTHAVQGRNPIDWPEKLEVVVMTHELGVSHHQYSALAQELASHGYAVIAIDHPYGGLSLLPGGRATSIDDNRSLAEEGLVATVENWAQDLSALLVMLEASRESSSPVLGRLALDRVAVIGHGLGAAAAFEAACNDPRIVAAVGLAGVPIGRTLEEGLCEPALVLQGRPTEEQATEGFSWDEFHMDHGGAIRIVSIPGADATSFYDLPFVLPASQQRAELLGQDPARTFALTSQLVRAFLGEHLRDDLPAPVRLDPETSAAGVELLELPGF